MSIENVLNPNIRLRNHITSIDWVQIYSKDGGSDVKTT